MSEGHIKRRPGAIGNPQKETLMSLILHNDEVNTFDFVIMSLEEVCKFAQTQATQIAFIAHYKGTCVVKKGSFDELDVFRKQLISRGLYATID